MVLAVVIKLFKYRKMLHHARGLLFISAPSFNFRFMAVMHRSTFLAHWPNYILTATVGADLKRSIACDIFLHTINGAPSILVAYHNTIS